MFIRDRALESQDRQYGDEGMTRIYERQTDAVFAAALAGNPDFARSFLNAVDRRPELLITSVRVQTPHRGEGHRGTIAVSYTHLTLPTIYTV